MEKLFIQILNRTLLVGCVVLLAGAILVAIGAGVTFLKGLNPRADHSDVMVAYAPLPPLPPATADPAESSSSQLSPEDLSLMNLATRGCEAIGHMAKAISVNKLDLHGAGLTTCEKDQVNAAKEFGDKAQNYLSVFSSYFDSMVNDAHVTTNYQNLSDDQTRALVDEVAKNFALKYKNEIDAQNARNAAAQFDAAADRLMSATLLGIAGAAFLAFLFIAFLIVFLRIEKHLDIMSAQSDNAARLSQ